MAVVAAAQPRPSFVPLERWRNVTPAQKRATRPQAPELDIPPNRFDPSDTGGRGFPERFLLGTLGLSKSQWNAMSQDEHDRAVAQVLAVLQPPFPEYLQAVANLRTWSDMSEAQREARALRQIQLNRGLRQTNRPEPYDYTALWKKLLRPSPERFQAELRKRGIPAPGAAFLRRQLLGDQSAKQRFAPPPKYRGHVYAPSLNSRWAADIMVLRGDKEDPWRHVLVVQDIFSRRAWVEEINRPPGAWWGMSKILRRAGVRPRELTTDRDVGFTSEDFAKLMRDERIVHTLALGRNDISTVDRLIFRLKRALAEEEEETGRGWEAALKDVVEGYNETGTSALYGSAPADVKYSNPSLIFQRQWDESHAMRDNAKQIHGRAEKLDELGGYRVLLKRGTWKKRRANEPVWGREVHDGVADIGGFINGVPTKEVLAVPRDSTELAPPADRPDYHARRVLGPLAAFLQERLAEGPLSFQRAKQLLEDRAGSPQALEATFREARTTLRGIVPGLARIFPEDFEVRGQKISLR
jgi:hypothetical protein